MFLATINLPQELMYFCHIGRVTVAELQRGQADIEKMLPDMKPGFRLLVDLSRVEEMELACVQQIGETMELLERHQVGLIVRLVPDEGKDIGFNIISAFHYKKRPQAATCKTMQEAARLLSL
jgi:hypothetical protein